MQNNRINATIGLVVLLLAGLATTACARPGGDGGSDGRRGPPPEAITACEGKSINDSCSFTGRRDDTIEGTCIAPQGVDELACAPEGGPPGGGR